MKKLFLLSALLIGVLCIGCTEDPIDASQDVPYFDNPNSTSNEIWYTTSDSNVIQLYYQSEFGANIVSNTYENGKGIITFDGPITTIGEMAFYNFSNLISVTIPNSVTTIKESAFYMCNSLESITIGNGVTTIEMNAISYCNSLKEFKGKFASADGRCLVVDGTLSAFAPYGLTEYIIPDSVTTIGEMTFYNCTNLTSVTIPNSVTEIEPRAFGRCNSLESVTIPNSVTTMGECAFNYCDNLKEFKGKFASADGRCLVVDGTLNSFAPFGLTEYAIPDGVTTIGAQVFCYCNKLTSITIPNSVTTIGNSAFYSCSCLTSIIVPDSVITIEEQAFYGCTSLTSVTIGNSVTTIEMLAFNYCFSLKEFKGKYASADGRCLIIDGTLNSFAPFGLTEYIIPNDVTTIGGWGFYGCSNLTSVTIPDSVATIQERAFDYCDRLESITIGNGVTTIEAVAFVNCLNLTSVYCKATTPPYASRREDGLWSSFENNAPNRHIYVPHESVEAYKAADGWSDYANAITGYDF